MGVVEVVAVTIAVVMVVVVMVAMVVAMVVVVVVMVAMLIVVAVVVVAMSTVASSVEMHEERYPPAPLLAASQRSAKPCSPRGPRQCIHPIHAFFMLSRHTDAVLCK